MPVTAPPSHGKDVAPALLNERGLHGEEILPGVIKHAAEVV